jgi:hypothetical protein
MGLKILDIPAFGTSHVWGMQLTFGVMQSLIYKVIVRTSVREQGARILAAGYIITIIIIIIIQSKIFCLPLSYKRTKD